MCDPFRTRMIPFYYLRMSPFFSICGPDSFVSREDKLNQIL